MTQYEESNLSALNAVDHPKDRRSIPGSRDSIPHDARFLRRGLTGIMILLAIVVVALVWTIWYLTSEMGNTEDLQKSQAIATREISESVRVVQTELQQIRQFLSSTSAENVIFLKMMTLVPDLDPQLGAQIARAVHRYGTLYGQDPNLIVSIIFIESKFDPEAVSSKGAVGLMQIMPQWKKVLGISEDLRDPDTSIKYGMQILGFYQEMYRDTEMALIAYNRGPGPVDMALMKGKNPNNGYPDRVMETYDKLKALNVGSL